MSGTNISAAQRTIGYFLRRPYEVLSERVYGGLAARGFPDIRPAHSVVFRHIALNGSRVSDLAEQAKLTKQSMAYLVDALSENGYLTVMADPADGRAKLVCLTPRGHEVSATLVALSREVEQDFARLMPPGQMTALRDLLGTLSDALG